MKGDTKHERADVVTPLKTYDEVLSTPSGPQPFVDPWLEVDFQILKDEDFRAETE